ncbi:hypothetical protein RFI_31356, partial [Reticulomyxa filosa]
MKKKKREKEWIEKMEELKNEDTIEEIGKIRQSYRLNQAQILMNMSSDVADIIINNKN